MKTFNGLKISSGLESLFADLQLNAKGAPLEQWQPAMCGSMPLKIDAAGNWWHAGSPLTRERMMQLFATVLWLENNQYYLKTPIEQIAIEVEDVPLLVDQIETQQLDNRQYIVLKTKQNDSILIDEEHIPFMRLFNGQWRPYIRVRRNLEALINRNTFYHLLNLGNLFEDDQKVGAAITSGTVEFTLAEPISNS